MGQVVVSKGWQSHPWSPSPFLGANMVHLEDTLEPIDLHHVSCLWRINFIPFTCFFVVLQVGPRVCQIRNGGRRCKRVSSSLSAWAYPLEPWAKHCVRSKFSRIWPAPEAQSKTRCSNDPCKISSRQWGEWPKFLSKNSRPVGHLQIPQYFEFLHMNGQWSMPARDTANPLWAQGVRRKLD